MDTDSLIFPNYDSMLHQSFVDMFIKGELTDATLICDNKRIQVHKFLLAAKSTFFKKVFNKPENIRKLEISNVNYDDLMTVLEYIYSGKVVLHPSNVASFMDATKQLSVAVDARSVAVDLTLSSIDGFSVAQNQRQISGAAFDSGKTDFAILFPE